METNLASAPRDLAASSGPPFEPDRRSPLDRILSIITDVRAGEGFGAVLLTADLTVLLGGYYLLKTVRESLILAQGGAEVKAYSSAAQAILLFGVVPVYGWIATRMNRNQLLRWTSIFFASNLLIFAYLGSRGVREAVPYFIWVGIFNVFTVAQLWAFATDLYTEAQGKRLFPMLGVGASVGAVGGAWIAGKLIEPLGPYKVMLIAAAALCLCAALSRWAGHVISAREGEREKKKDTETLGPRGGFQLLISDPYLRLIALLTILLNIVSLSGDFIVGKLVINHANEVVGLGKQFLAARGAYIGAYYANYYAWTNLVSFVIQAFLVSRIFKYIGVRGSLFILPALSFATFGVILVHPILSVVRNLKIAENGTNYSLQNTIRNALLLPTSREAKYKAKAAIETFCVRLGDVLQAGIIFLGTRLHASLTWFATITLGFTALWVLVAGALYREHCKTSQEC
ncbi:MAG TPA: Npt1/Npt2 family nucleotide transporter [Terriglobales bacterium]|jgi:AAA family ATP:ADP antiporter|nr:Npt1/Npt2 family nucleotide transporter [Terriglobales bacterium]